MGAAFRWIKDNDFEVEGVRDCIAAAGPVYRLFEASDNLEVVYPDTMGSQLSFI